MTARKYNQAGTVQENTSIARSIQQDEVMNQMPANDSHTSREKAGFTNQAPGHFNRVIANKLLQRKRKKSRHPLRDLRLQRGFTLEELADLTKLSPSYLSRLESGTRRLNADILQRLAHVLSCHPGDLLPTDSYGSKFSMSGSTLSSYDTQEQIEGFALTRFNAPDLPLYQLKTIDAKNKRLELESPEEWVNRPYELMGVVGAISFQISDTLNGPRYRLGDRVYAHPSRPLAQNCSVLAITHDNQAYFGEFVGWQSQQDPIDHITLRIANEQDQGGQQIQMKNESLKAVYRIIGLMEAS